MNTLEYIHDVVGENEREAVLPDEDINPQASVDQEPMGNSISVSHEGAKDSNGDDTASHVQDVQDPVVGSTDSPPRAVADRD